jgi:hypothetical protein
MAPAVGGLFVMIRDWMHTSTDHCLAAIRGHGLLDILMYEPATTYDAFVPEDLPTRFIIP